MFTLKNTSNSRTVCTNLRMSIIKILNIKDLLLKKKFCFKLFEITPLAKCQKSKSMAWHDMACWGFTNLRCLTLSESFRFIFDRFIYYVRCWSELIPRHQVALRSVRHCRFCRSIALLIELKLPLSLLHC